MSTAMSSYFTLPATPPTCAGCDVRFRIGEDLVQNDWYEVTHVAPDGTREAERFDMTPDAQERIRQWLAGLHADVEAKPANTDPVLDDAPVLDRLLRNFRLAGDEYHRALSQLDDAEQHREAARRQMVIAQERAITARQAWLGYASGEPAPDCLWCHGQGERMLSRDVIRCYCVGNLDYETEYQAAMARPAGKDDS